MTWFYLIVVAVVGLLWRSRRHASHGLLSPSELGEVLGRSRDVVDGDTPDQRPGEPPSDR